jgi:hypothetical protein
MLFTKGLGEPIRGWVKEFRPTTMHESIMRCQNMKDAVNKKYRRNTSSLKVVMRQGFHKIHGQGRTGWMRRIREK